MTFNSFKGVFFDAGNTLLRVHPSIGVVYSEAAGMFGVEVSPEFLETAFSNLWSQTGPLVNNEGQRLTYEKERDWWKYIVKQVFQELIPPDKFDSFFDHLYARFEHSDSWRLYDDVVSVLHTLKSDQMRLAVISNWDSRLPSLCDQLGLTPYFETLVVSSLVGYEKPHPAIFQIALDRTGLSPHEVIYVGDDPYLDYQGARKAGMKALHLDRNNRYPEHAERITTLNDILKLLNLNGR